MIKPPFIELFENEIHVYVTNFKYMIHIAHINIAVYCNVLNVDTNIGYVMQWPYLIS